MAKCSNSASLSFGRGYVRTIVRVSRPTMSPGPTRLRLTSAISAALNCSSTSATARALLAGAETLSGSVRPTDIPRCSDDTNVRLASAKVLSSVHWAATVGASTGHDVQVAAARSPNRTTTWIEAGPLTNPVPVARRVERVGSVENPHIVGAAAPDAHEGIGIRRRYLLVFPDTI